MEDNKSSFGGFLNKLSFFLGVYVNQVQIIQWNFFPSSLYRNDLLCNHTTSFNQSELDPTERQLLKGKVCQQNTEISNENWVPFIVFVNLTEICGVTRKNIRSKVLVFSLR